MAQPHTQAGPIDLNDPRTRWRLGFAVAVLAVIVGVALLLDVGPFGESPKTEADEVAAVVERFVAAGNDRDFETTCELLSAGALRLIDKQAAAEPPPTEGSNLCVRVLASRAGAESGGTEIEILATSISGNRAAVEVRMKRAGEPAREQQIQLVREGGQWKIETAV